MVSTFRESGVWWTSDCCRVLAQWRSRKGVTWAQGSVMVRQEVSPAIQTSCLGRAGVFVHAEAREARIVCPRQAAGIGGPWRPGSLRPTALLGKSTVQLEGSRRNRRTDAWFWRQPVSEDGLEQSGGWRGRQQKFVRGISGRRWDGRESCGRGGKVQRIPLPMSDWRAGGRTIFRESTDEVVGVPLAFSTGGHHANKECVWSWVSHSVNGIHPAPDIHEHFMIHKGYGTLRISSRRTTSTILSAL